MSYYENVGITGCSGRKKAKFYQRLFSLLISEWILALGDEANDDAITSKDKAVRWKFEQLDVNNNSVCLYCQPNDIIFLLKRNLDKEWFCIVKPISLLKGELILLSS